MNAQSLYAFYGTLRVGMENHSLLGASAKFLKRVKLPGFKLFSLVEYPYAVKSRSLSDMIVAELFYIPDKEVQEYIHSMELDAGYYYYEVQIEGKKYGIYLFSEEVKGHERILSGDWAEYVGNSPF